VGHKRYILYNTINRAEANKGREVRGLLLVKVLATRQRVKQYYYICIDLYLFIPTYIYYIV
jgi:hypothetical protein